MDRSLDEIVADRRPTGPRGGNGGGRRGAPPPRRGNYPSYPRDGVRKVAPVGSSVVEKYQRANQQPGREDRTNLDNDWVHDRYDDEEPANSRGGNPRSRARRDDRHDDRREPRRDEPRYDDDRDHDHDRSQPPAKIRVENLHYDLTENDVFELFTRIAPVADVKMRFDRAGRSEGTATVTYNHVADAREAIKEFDGANAKGQPIRLQLIPLPARRDNPFDRVENPRSLFDRIEAPSGRNRRRSESPVDDVEDDRGYRRAPRRGAPTGTGRERRSDVTRPAPENIDRYIPGQTDSRSSSHRGGRRPGERRERAPRGGRDTNGHQIVGGRPRKTQEELDAEMDDYWGSSGNAAENGTTNAASHSEPPANDDDIDMIT